MKGSEQEEFEEETQDEPNLEAAASESRVLELIKKLQQHMAFLEKKIDMLLERSGGQDRERSFRRNNEFSRPPRRQFGRFQGGGGRDRGPRREGGGFSQDRGPRHEGGGNFSQDRGGFSKDRGNFSQERSYDRQPGAGGGDRREGFAGKKPFPRQKKRWR